MTVTTTSEDQASARLSTLSDVAAQRALKGEEASMSDNEIVQAWRECEFVGDGGGMGGEMCEGVTTIRAYLGLESDIVAEHLSELLEILARLSGVWGKWYVVLQPM